MLRSGIILLSLFAAIQARVMNNDPTRIVNGQNAKLGEIPYQVSLQYISEDFHFCGGSILNQNYIITAAHCLTYTEPREIQVVVGTLDLNEPQAVHLVSNIYVHENFSVFDSFNDDIALIKVESPITLTETVAPAVLPKPNAKVAANEKAVVSGWGRLWNGGPRLATLRRVDVLIADQEYCRKVYYDATIHDSQICAHDPVAEHGSCKGDSGGPLTVDGVLVGLVSWANGCAQVKYPTVFTRVSSYLDWIDSIQKSNIN